MDAAPALRAAGLSQRGLIAALVVAEGCREDTRTGRVARARVADVLGSTERTATRALRELTDSGVAVVVERGRRTSNHANGQGPRGLATRYRLSPLPGPRDNQVSPDSDEPQDTQVSPDPDQPGDTRVSPSHAIADPDQETSAAQPEDISAQTGRHPGVTPPVVSSVVSPGGVARETTSEQHPLPPSSPLTQPCGRRHDPDTPCRPCGDARKADEQQVADAAAADAAERADAARQRRECPRCDPNGWLEDPHTGAPRGRCNHRSDPREQLTRLRPISEADEVPDRRPAEEPDRADPYAHECPKCHAQPGELCRRGGKRTATLTDPHDRRVRLATERAA
ncbi:zinc finger domain-containing protein [Actinomycetospora flava]|uniref:zinc finger domain-containing protein n=1 Tax=Actinomycetospora flava TaxID=3129232 RepID=UPI00403878F1